LKDFYEEIKIPGFDLKTFLDKNFDYPEEPEYKKLNLPKAINLEDRLKLQWDLLTREADEEVENSSLILCHILTLCRVEGFGRSIIGIVILPCWG
jgi:alpha,alpha-trehalase